jgi:5-methylcytosine-specific restriction endonuclease McrA
VTEQSWNAIRRLVFTRAGGCCEYCRSCEANTGQAMEVEHIDPAGGDVPENLCLSCGNCNRSKAIATTALDPATGDIVPLHNPRQQQWAEHFQWSNDSSRVEGKTATGRATVARFKMNRRRIVNARKRWVVAGYHPPKDE